MAVNVIPATPLALNPVPVAEALVIVTLELPVFVSVTFSELLLPSLTLAKFKLVGFALKVRVAAWPVPLKAMESGEFGALLTIEIEPLTFPAPVGVNTALKVLLLPALIVIGSAGILLIVNPVPETVACETDTAAVPPFVRLIVWELLLPTVTVPRFALDGFEVSWPCTPVPLIAIDAGEPGALLAIEMLPVTLPLAVGENFAANVTLAPGLIVCAPTPVMLKPVPDAVTLVMFNAPLPGLERVTFTEETVPTVTLPKGTLDGLMVSCG